MHFFHCYNDYAFAWASKYFSNYNIFVKCNIKNIDLLYVNMFCNYFLREKILPFYFNLNCVIY